MCGIYCSVSFGSQLRCCGETKELLQARGPDHLQELSFPVEVPSTRPSLEIYENEKVNVYVLSTVLALRGDHVVPQPLQSTLSHSFLCWNGEAWKHNSQLIAGSDSEHVFRLLRPDSPSTQFPDRRHILDVLTNIAGPFAFVFYDGGSHRLFYGRDHLGRRSLVSRVFPDGGMAFCSIIDGSLSPGWKEVQPGGVSIIELSHSPLVPEYFVSPSHRPSINREVPQGQVPALNISSLAVLELERHLRDSLRLRIADIPTLGQCGEQRTAKDAKIAVLFSGGLDCALLARLAHGLLPINEPIDLLNVAFENPRSMAAASKTENPLSAYESCPDRRTGRSSYLELLRVCGGRTWRFIAIDVPYSESENHRETILRLMAPHNTEMDLSIAKAFYFAARGKGQATNLESRCDDPWCTGARVLLSGLGADELFGGYGRHATSFARQGYQGLIDEMDLDVYRIGQRNLGRDDRVTSHWGKEVRYPYLDEDFMRWALRLPVWEKCGFVPDCDMLRKEDIHAAMSLEPAKQVLRFLAWRLGMGTVATLKKRAIQFGARTAKMTKGTGRTKGTDCIT